jgi:transcription initiation factor IIE alpha subunit
MVRKASWNQNKILILTQFSETKQQPRADGKIITRNYFYIDYKQFVDIVKYRIYKMRHSVEEMIKKVVEFKFQF